MNIFKDKKEIVNKLLPMIPGITNIDSKAKLNEVTFKFKGRTYGIRLWSGFFYSFDGFLWMTEETLLFNCILKQYIKERDNVI